MNIKGIREVIKFLEEHPGVVEIEVGNFVTRIRVSKHIRELSVPQIAYPSVRTEAVKEAAKTTHERGFIEIKSPMVGTFYRAPAPGARPFVEINSRVEVGQTVCVIEAMKLMNEIKSDVSGRVARILVENGAPVGYGRVLFLVQSD
jgi:acetyl-CoA carboxylase biotin carboxyl carrier protein